MLGLKIGIEATTVNKSYKVGVGETVKKLSNILDENKIKQCREIERRLG